MASLREIKDRIGSVRSTLKITGAMKLVASAKLRKAQQAIAALLPYEQTLHGIVSLVAGSSGELAGSVSDTAPVAVVAVASDSSLCGSFNANIIRHALAEAGRYADPVIYPVGRKMVEAMKKTGYQLEYSDNLAASLADKFDRGEYSKVLLVYTHYVSTASQRCVTEQFLPFTVEVGDEAARKEELEGYIVEPSASDIVRALLPQMLSLKMKAVLLDSEAAEQAARTIAMQTASDNAEDILEELTLQYNKGRQQKITAEILDIVGGSMQ